MLTNKLGLPEPLVEAIRNDGYSRGDADYSITQLIDSPRRVQLTRRHEPDEDAADRIWSLIGQVAHTLLERANATGIAEERLFAEVGGVRISGQVDHICLISDTMSDYKVTSAWSVLQDQVKPEWEAQLNAYRWLAAQNSYTINKLQIVAILRDWSKHRAKEQSSYPQHAVAIVDVPVWPIEYTADWVRSRIMLHQQAANLADEDLPLCTDAEKWRRPDQFAVMKGTNKRATKLHDDLAEAEADAAERGPEYHVAVRPGECVRCASYCAVSGVCNDWTPPTGLAALL